MREFTQEELAACDGREGRPAIGNSRTRRIPFLHGRHMRGGRHQVPHRAGRDLTEALPQAPHGPELLEKFPVVGTLKGGEDA